MDCSVPGSFVHGTSQTREHWSVLPFPPSADLLYPGIIESTSPALAGRFFTLWATREVQKRHKWLTGGFPDGAVGKHSTCQCRRPTRRKFDPWFGKIPWRRKWKPTPVVLLGKSHGQRSPAGYSPWSFKEWNMSEWLRTHADILYINYSAVIERSKLPCLHGTLDAQHENEMEFTPKARCW